MVTRYARELPDALGVEEAARLLEAAPDIKYKAALGVAYGAAWCLRQEVALSSRATSSRLSTTEERRQASDVAEIVALRLP